MNYEGCVSSVNTSLWTFELDNKILVHMGQLAANDASQMMPEIGAQVQLYNAHYKTSELHQLEKMFLCEESTFICDSYKTYVREDSLLKIIQDFNLGVADLLEIDFNIALVENSIKDLVQQSTAQIIIEVVRCIANENSFEMSNIHRCLNKRTAAFTLKSISSCCYIDLTASKKSKGPPWSFGVHSKSSKCDILIGYIQINKRFGLAFLCDTNHKMPCFITTRNRNLDKNCILNKFVLVKNYLVFTETYREVEAPSSEYILFDIEDVIVLDLQPMNPSSQSVFVQKLSDDFPYIYKFEFKLCRKSTVSFANNSIECWLEVLIMDNPPYLAYLGLNAYQVQIVPYLLEDQSYYVYHSEKLKDSKHLELQRLNRDLSLQKFTEKTAIFMQSECLQPVPPVLSVAEVLETIKTTNKCLSFQGILNVKKLTPALTSRTWQRQPPCTGFGTPGSQTHTLVFVDDARRDTLLLYLNNWENLQIPLGLILNMRLCVRNVVPQKNKYLKSCALTTFEVLGYEPLVFFDTVNLNNDEAPGCDKYSFVGLGDLIPCNVLIWARTVQLHIRSLRIMCTCNSCTNKLTDCSCENAESTLETTITFYAYDEMGQAMVISKSLEVLRLLLNLEVKQWKIWCEAFKNIKEYVHDFDATALFSYDPPKNAFCEALAISIRTFNAKKISDIEVKCRKMECSTEDNEGMPKWFCIDARKQEDI